MILVVLSATSNCLHTPTFSWLLVMKSPPAWCPDCSTCLHRTQITCNVSLLSTALLDDTAEPTLEAIKHMKVLKNALSEAERL